MAVSCNFKIRLAAEQDWTSILSIERTRYGIESYSVYSIRMMPLLHGRTCWVAEVKDKLVGYSLGAREDISPDTGWLLSVVILKDYESRGIGSALCSQCIEEFKLMGVQKVKLTVEPSNKVAIHIYEQLGFKSIGEQCDFYGPGKDRLLMQLESDQMDRSHG